MESGAQCLRHSQRQPWGERAYSGRGVARSLQPWRPPARRRRRADQESRDREPPVADPLRRDRDRPRLPLRELPPQPVTNSAAGRRVLRARADRARAGDRGDTGVHRRVRPQTTRSRTARGRGERRPHPRPDEALLNTYQQLLQVREALDDLEIQRAQLETTLGSRSEQQPGSKGSRAGRPTPAIGSIPTGADSPSPSSTPDFCVSRESVPSASSQAATTTEGVV